MNKWFLGVAAAAMLSGSANDVAAQVSMDWFNTGGTIRVTDNLGANLGGSDTIGWVQLIWVGANATVDTAINSGDGTTGDDEVIGFGTFINAGAAAGFFSVIGTDVSAHVGRDVYVRAWENQGGTLGDAPTGAQEYYGDSVNNDQGTPSFGLYTITSTDGQQLNFSNGGPNGNVSWSTSSQTPAVPEPTTMALFAAGAACMALRRKRKDGASSEV